MKKKILIFIIICVVFGLSVLGYSVYRGLSLNSRAYDTICNSNNSWKCKQVDMVLYPKKTDKYKKLQQQYDLNDLRFEMIGVLNFKNQKTVVCFTHGNSTTFTISRADSKCSIITGSYDLAFLGFGDDIVLKNLKYSNDFDLEKSKLTLSKQ